MPIINKLPTTGSSGGDTGNKMNIFVQPTEPYIKDGVWIQTDQISESLLIKDNWVDGSWSRGTNIPYDFSNSGVTIVNDDIYLIGSGASVASRVYNYKYNTISDTYTKMANIPYDFQDGTIESYNNYIYMFGGGVNASTYYNCYRYDTSSNTYTKLTVTLPTDVSYHIISAVSDGIGNMYIFSGNACYRFNTILNVFTKLASMPAPFAGNFIAKYINGVIYVVGGNTSNAVIKYDIMTNTYTRVTNIPFDWSLGGVTVVDTDILIFGGGFKPKKMYIYNTISDKYTQLMDLQYDHCPNGDTTAYSSSNNKIYAFGHMYTGTRNYNRIYNLPTKILHGNTVVVTIPLDGSGTYQTQFYQLPIQNFTSVEFGKFKSKFNDVSLGLGDTVNTTLPTYYGDGEQWIKFKN